MLFCLEEYQLLEDSEIKLLDEDENPIRVDHVWASILQMTTPMGEERFPNLKKNMKAVLSLPHSNADCERVFSQVRKIHTDCRKNLNSDTLTALLQCKILRISYGFFQKVIQVGIRRGWHVCEWLYIILYPKVLTCLGGRYYSLIGGESLAVKP